MPLFILPFDYLRWHYTLAWRDLILISRNFLWFSYHFFSLPVLVRTLFAPWRRLNEAYPVGFDLGGFLSALFINMLMRLIGFWLRTIMIIVGLAVCLLLFLFSLAVFIVWLFLPFLLLTAMLLGLVLIFFK